MPRSNQRDDGRTKLEMRALRAWRRRWAYELSGMHRIPARSPVLFCFLLLFWFPLVALWWYTGADQYRAVAWLASSANDSQSRRPESVALLVSTQRQSGSWPERLNLRTVHTMLFYIQGVFDIIPVIFVFSFSTHL